METINQWIDTKFKEVMNKLPDLTHSDPASFSCGFNGGYKQALIDLDRFMEELKDE